MFRCSGVPQEFRVFSADIDIVNVPASNKYTHCVTRNISKNFSHTENSFSHTTKHLSSTHTESFETGKLSDAFVLLGNDFGIE